MAPLLGEAPQVLLAERSLPGSLMVDWHGRRFVNEAVGYMSFGQTVLDRERIVATHAARQLSTSA
ncbi:hypothetical protein ACFQ3B_05635 [Stackebrandtia endophytica]|uniref:hypothetical protein n=1 Tax=Stackebrandtia endophytica TaxID=1496996 RepID=UPI0014768144|nr:hypothetical protein [Stackebrandtia endophytica]